MPAVRRGVAGMGTTLRWASAGIGVLVAAHWVTFYASVKLANASVAATCTAVTPVFLAPVEP